jgi:hypothetical protein
MYMIAMKRAVKELITTGFEPATLGIYSTLTFAAPACQVFEASCFCQLG